MLNLRGNQFTGYKAVLGELPRLEQQFVEDNNFAGADEGIASLRPLTAPLLCQPESESPDCIVSPNSNNADAWEGQQQAIGEYYDSKLLKEGMAELAAWRAALRDEWQRQNPIN